MRVSNYTAILAIALDPIQKLKKEKILLKSGENIIGSNKAKSTIQINSIGIDEIHAQITINQQGEVFIEDLGDTGVYKYSTLNKRLKIRLTKGQKYELTTDQEYFLGKYQFFIVQNEGQIPVKNQEVKEKQEKIEATLVLDDLPDKMDIFQNNQVEEITGTLILSDREENEFEKEFLDQKHKKNKAPFQQQNIDSTLIVEDRDDIEDEFDRAFEENKQNKNHLAFMNSKKEEISSTLLLDDRDDQEKDAEFQLALRGDKLKNNESKHIDKFDATLILDDVDETEAKFEEEIKKKIDKNKNPAQSIYFTPTLIISQVSQDAEELLQPNKIQIQNLEQVQSSTLKVPQKEQNKDRDSLSAGGSEMGATLQVDDDENLSQMGATLKRSENNSENLSNDGDRDQDDKSLGATLVVENEDQDELENLDAPVSKQPIPRRDPIITPSKQNVPVRDEQKSSVREIPNKNLEQIETFKPAPPASQSTISSRIREPPQNLNVSSQPNSINSFLNQLQSTKDQKETQPLKAEDEFISIFVEKSSQKSSDGKINNQKEQEEDLLSRNYSRVFDKDRPSQKQQDVKSGENSNENSNVNPFNNKKQTEINQISKKTGFDFKRQQTSKVAPDQQFQDENLDQESGQKEEKDSEKKVKLNQPDENINFSLSLSQAPKRRIRRIKQVDDEDEEENEDLNQAQEQEVINSQNQLAKDQSDNNKSSQDSDNSQKSNKKGSQNALTTKSKQLKSIEEQKIEQKTPSKLQTVNDSSKENSLLHLNKIDKLKVSFSGFQPTPQQKKVLKEYSMEYVQNKQDNFDILIVRDVMRTIKLLQALIDFIPIVNESWLEACRKEKQVVKNLQQFIPENSEFQSQFGCEFKDIVQLRIALYTGKVEQQYKLFEGIKLWISPKISNANDIRFIFQLAGGTIYDQIPNKSTAQEKSFYAVLSISDKPMYDNYTAFGLECLEVEYILGGILLSQNAPSKYIIREPEDYFEL